IIVQYLSDTSLEPKTGGLRRVPQLVDSYAVAVRSFNHATQKCNCLLIGEAASLKSIRAQENSDTGIFTTSLQPICASASPTGSPQRGCFAPFARAAGRARSAPRGGRGRSPRQIPLRRVDQLSG